MRNVLLCLMAAALLLLCGGRPVMAEEIVTETAAECTHENTELVNVSAATTESKGYTGDLVCTDCGETLQKGSKIARIKKVTLSKTSYVYNGEKRTPGVTVTDTDGKKIKSTNYTVTYKNNKAVGTATVKIRFSGSYSGTVTKTFKIRPKATKLTGLTGVSKGFTAKWKTVSEQVSGYQIQCATNSDFTKGKQTITVSGKKTKTTTVTSVKAKKKYYVRIRTYKTVDGVNYYSKWSSAKTVTTKKRITVFAGDSIATGLYASEYNGISMMDIPGTNKVVAYKGLNTMTYQTRARFNGMSGLEKVISYQPYRVYLMLGINEIEWRKVNPIVEDYAEIVEAIQDESPATDIVILSVSPVSRSVASKSSGFKNIEKLNKKLKAMAEEYGVKYYDYSAAFEDSSGYLLSKYNDGDGIHWPKAAYRKFAKLISAYDAELEEQ
ncbi:MAG: GDSL-type esterase/lipase family protein [Lachnospiraceae bacterium]|nr:GDSL-type esterase/lipase family protein [Lachnospiraceae bacterium]